MKIENLQHIASSIPPGRYEFNMRPPGKTNVQTYTAHINHSSHPTVRVVVRRQLQGREPEIQYRKLDPEGGVAAKVVRHLAELVETGQRTSYRYKALTGPRPARRGPNDAMGNERRDLFSHIAEKREEAATGAYVQQDTFQQTMDGLSRELEGLNTDLGELNESLEAFINEQPLSKENADEMAQVLLSALRKSWAYICETAKNNPFMDEPGKSVNEALRLLERLEE